MGNFITKIFCCVSRLGRGRIRANDRRTRKLMTVHWSLNPTSVVVRIYLSRKEGGRGLIIVEDSKIGYSRA